MWVRGHTIRWAPCSGHGGRAASSLTPLYNYTPLRLCASALPRDKQGSHQTRHAPWSRCHCSLSRRHRHSSWTDMARHMGGRLQMTMQLQWSGVYTQINITAVTHSGEGEGRGRVEVNVHKRAITATARAGHNPTGHTPDQHFVPVVGERIVRGIVVHHAATPEKGGGEEKEGDNKSSKTRATPQQQDSTPCRTSETCMHAALGDERSLMPL